jgi:multidrug transporter EmrE-like cation transporter
MGVALSDFVAIKLNWFKGCQMTWLVFILVILCNSFANIFIKAGMRGRKFDGNLAASLLSAFLSPPLICGIMLFVVALVGYSFVLSKMNLSVVYPILTTMAFIVVISASWLFFDETIKVLQIMGYILILSGVWLVTR